jgi:RNA polymerase sigma factor (sigma-70 family)
LQGDDKLIALIRNGNNAAFEALVQRYQPRLLAFCRHMLSSQEDAEDVLQEVFAASFNALLADNRPINARPWLYRIARNRCLNHLRKPKAVGQDSMDIFERDNGSTTAETVHRREEFRDIVSDVGELPETQRTALLLREIDALSYDQIAEAMDTTIPSIKSLLVRARVSLAEASEARLLTCGEVRMELGEVAEGLARTTPPVRRHLKSCDRCRTFRAELRKTNKALAAVFPLGPLVILKKLGIAKLGFGGTGAAGGSGATAGGTGIAGGAGVAAGGAAAGGAAAGGMLSAGVGTIASKAAAGMAAAVIVTAGAAEVRKVAREPAPAPVVSSSPEARHAPAKPALAPENKVAAIEAPAAAQAAAAAAEADIAAPEPAAAAPASEPEPTAPVAEPEPVPAADSVVPEVPLLQEEKSSTTLPPRAKPIEGEEPVVVENGLSGQPGQAPPPPAPPAGGGAPSQQTPLPPPPGL